MPDRAELLRLLTEYQPDDADEQRYRAEMLDLAAASIDPFDRYDYLPGHFTSSAFVLGPGGDSVLLVHHARLDIWVQPGGHVEPGDESLLEAAQREVTEETGVSDLEAISDGIIDIDIHVFPESGDQEEHRHYDLRFGFVARSGELVSNDEVHEVAWVPGSDIDAYGVDRSVVRPVSKLLEIDTLSA